MKFLVEKYYVYILTNSRRTVLYVGYTEDLKRRIYFHRHRLIAGFTKKYNLDQLVYFEEFLCFDKAIDREKQIKKYRRQKKDILIEKMNPSQIDLYEGL